VRLAEVRNRLLAQDFIFTDEHGSVKRIVLFEDEGIVQ